MGRNRQPLSKTVKDIVDLVFELTTSNPDGYDFKSGEFGYNGERVVKILVQRGIVERKRNNVSGANYRYKWVAASAPTKVLYGSIAQEISDYYKAKNAKYAPKKKTVDNVAVVNDIMEAPVKEPDLDTFQDAPAEIAPSLDPFSAQELWDELKRRGFFIEGDRICIVKKAYID